MSPAESTAHDRTSPAPALGAACLVAAPLLILAGEALHPRRASGPLAQVAVVGRHAAAWYASHLLLWAGVVLMLPAILRLASLVHRHAPRLALAGGGLAGLGAVCFAGLLTMGFVVWQMAAPEADQAQMAALFKRLFHAPGFLIPFEILPLGFAVGMTLIAVGLRRSGRASRWSAVTISLGAVGISLIGIVPSSIYALTASSALAAGLAPLGCTLLAEWRAARGAGVARRSIQAQAR